MNNAPKGKYMAVVKLGDKGQIVIPKDARDLMGIGPGDQLMLLCDIKRGIALVKNDHFLKMAENIMEAQTSPVGPDDKEGEN